MNRAILSLALMPLSYTVFAQGYSPPPMPDKPVYAPDDDGSIKPAITKPDLSLHNSIYSKNRGAVPIVVSKPEYPPAAVKQGLSGYVILEFTVTAKGKVKNIHIVESSPKSVFDKSAIQAASKIRYAAKQIDGKAVRADALVMFKYDFKPRNISFSYKRDDNGSASAAR